MLNSLDNEHLKRNLRTRVNSDDCLKFVMSKVGLAEQAGLCE